MWRFNISEIILNNLDLGSLYFVRYRLKKLGFLHGLEFSLKHVT